MNTQNYLTKSRILDFESVDIESLIMSRGWRDLDEFDRIGAAYDYVRNEIKFGYNKSDDLTASQVLQQGYGQCNTKGNLLMALLRALNIPCRFHGFTIDNQLQKGAIPAYIFPFAPKHILHSWVEVWFNDSWVDLEGFILDSGYLRSIQSRQNNTCESYKGYAIATNCLQKPDVDWVGKSTYIQREGIHHDYGVFDTPDDFYNTQGTNLSGLKRVIFQYFLRHLMNLNLSRIRQETK